MHNEAEAERAIEAGASLFGINNRDLHTFNVDLATTERIRPLLPAGAMVVGESGVHTRATSSGCTPPACAPSSSARRS